jgi:hypothetical protein
VPEPALEFAVLSTKAASEKKPVTLQCSIRCFFERFPYVCPEPVLVK